MTDLNQAFCVNAPIHAKFGLHYRGLGTLPTMEELEQVKSYLTSMPLEEPLALSILPELSFLEERGEDECYFALTIPTLAFTDPAFDYDVRPMFLTPLALNGYVAQKNNVSSSRPIAIEVMDIAGNRYFLKFDEKGALDFEAIAKQLSIHDNVFTTMKSLTYIYSKEQIFGHCLQPLEGNEGKGKITFIPPIKLRNEYPLTIRILRGSEGFKNELHRRDTILRPTFSKKGKFFVSHFDTILENKKGIPELTIRFGIHSTDEIASSRYGYTLFIHTPVEVEFGKIQNAFNEVVSVARGELLDKECQQKYKMHQFTYYSGLSQKAFKELLAIILPKDRFIANHTKLSSQVKKDKITEVIFNDYSKNPVALDCLYELVMSGVIEKTIPLFALSECFAPAKSVYETICMMNTDNWDAHDHFVLQNMITHAEREASMNGMMAGILAGFELVDRIEVLLSESATDLETNLKIQLTKGKLKGSEVIGAEIFFDTLSNNNYQDKAYPSPVLTISKTISSDDFTELHVGNQSALLR